MRTNAWAVRPAIGAVLAGVLILAGLSSAGGTGGVAAELVSVSSSGEQALGQSFSPAISADGRYVAFESVANNLVPDDTNGQDVFLHDRQNGTTTLISLATDGAQANRTALNPGVNGDGRYVVFDSDADNLVPDDTNGASDVFLRDTVAGTTTRVSVSSDGAQGENDSLTPSISADGRYVTFTSLAANLVAGDENNDRDVFLHDTQTGVTELISVSTEGVQGNLASGGVQAGPGRVSADGRYVVFGSIADNLAPDDTNQADDVFFRDRHLGTTEMISVNAAGEQGDSHSMHPDVSDNGLFVVFDSIAGNLVANDGNNATDVFCRDRASGQTFRLSQLPNGAANDASYFPTISGDGRWTAFASEASNLVADDMNDRTDVFRFDAQSGTIERVSVSTIGVEGNGDSTFSDLSRDGAIVAYQSSASNLVPNDANGGAADIFVRGKPLREATPMPTSTRTPTPRATPTSTPERLGDVDCSRRVDSVDAALVLQLTGGLLDALRCPDAADVNGSGRVDSVDAALILQFVAGLLGSLPP